MKSRAGTSAKIIGSVWSPPANCKDNNSINDGGHLKTSCYDSWSTTIANFAGARASTPCRSATSPTSRPAARADPCNGNYPTTLFTANEMVAWVKVAGPKLQAKGVKVIAPEASEWEHTWSNKSAGPDVPAKNSSDPLKCGFPPTTKCNDGSGYDYGHFLAKDTAAWAAIDILGVHEYDSQVAMPWPADVNGGKPNKEVWQTEMSGVKWWPEQGPSSDINNGVAVAGWIHSAHGGRRRVGLALLVVQGVRHRRQRGPAPQERRRHQAPLDARQLQQVRPAGLRARRRHGRAFADVLLSAYKGTDGTVVVVAINKGTAAASLPIAIAGGTAPAMMTPWVTSSTDNLVSKTAVAVSGGSFTAALAATTVTTFVGK